MLTPPASVRVNAAFAKLVMAFPAASSTTIVVKSVEPETSVELAKLTVDWLAEMEPAVTCTVGFVVSDTLLTLAVSVAAVPRCSP